MPGNLRTSEGLRKTFHAACHASTTQGLPLNTAGIAGMLLELFESPIDARDAALRMPEGEVWAEVARYLDEVLLEERTAAQRPMAGGGERR